MTKRSSLDLSSWSAEDVGLLLTALLMGCELESTLAIILDGKEDALPSVDVDDCNVVDDEEMVCRACRPIPDDLEADAVLGLSTVEKGSGVREMWVPCPACFDEETGKSTGKVCEEGRMLRCKECDGKRGWWDDASSINAYFTTTGDNPVLRDQATIADEEGSAGGANGLVPEFSTHFVPFFYKGTRAQWTRFSGLMQSIRKLNAEQARKWMAKWQTVDRFERVGVAFRMTRKGITKRFIWKPVYLNQVIVAKGDLTKRQAWSVYRAMAARSK